MQTIPGNLDPDTPAMAAGVSKTLWEISDIVALIPEEAPKKRGSYKKKCPNAF